MIGEFKDIVIYYRDNIVRLKKKFYIIIIRKVMEYVCF